jgi:hypothetical protein
MTSLIAHRELRFRREFRQADKFDALDQARDFRAGGTSPCDGERLLMPRKRLTLCVTPRDPQTLEEGRQRFAFSRQIDVQNSADSAGLVKFQILLASMCEGVATMRKMIQERDHCPCGR